MNKTFYHGYYGSKRLEYKYIKDYLKKINFNKLVEPFGGSGSTSYLYWLENQDKKIKYVINDIDPYLYELNNCIKKDNFKIIEDFIEKNFNSESFEKIKDKLKKDNEKCKLEEKFYFKKVYHFHPGVNMFKHSTRAKNALPFKFKNHSKRIEFDKINEYQNKDYKEIFKKYKNDKNALLYLDPPYLMSYNSMYIETDIKEVKNKKMEIKDETKIYIDILDLLKNSKCKIIFVSNSNSMIKYIFKDYIKDTYLKTYFSPCKSKKGENFYRKCTEHLIISNF